MQTEVEEAHEGAEYEVEKWIRCEQRRKMGCSDEGVEALSTGAPLTEVARGREEATVRGRTSLPHRLMTTCGRARASYEECLEGFRPELCRAKSVWSHRARSRGKNVSDL